MPTVGFHAPEDSPLVEAVRKRANQKFRGSVSAYVRSLVERDLENRLPANVSSSNLLLELCEVVAPALVAEIREWCQKNPELNQPRVISAFMEALLRVSPEDVLNYHFT